jgi:polyphosphate glucokinase
MDVLVVDVGGSNVKLKSSGAQQSRRFRSGPDLTPTRLVEQVLHHSADWHYDVISLGFPGPLERDGPKEDPLNLGNGWVGFDFSRVFDVPVRVVNDAVMQALGGYESGRMLFVGLGTGVGSALVTEHVVVPLEIGSLPHMSGGTIVDHLGRAGRDKNGHAAWQQALTDITPVLRDAFTADYVLLGGGNAKNVDPLPPQTRRGHNDDAFVGGFRLWEEVVEPHDRQPPRVWRVVR